MIHYLRRNGVTIVDIEATQDDIQCVVCIEAYSRFLLENQHLSDAISFDFEAIQEIRGEYFEGNFAALPDEHAKNRLLELARKYELQYVTD